MGEQFDPFGNKIELHEDDIRANDINQSQFAETFYNLVLKDYQLVHFFRDLCPHADFIFKGDDDIILNPQLIAEKVIELQPGTESEFIGCVKTDAEVNRQVKKCYEYMHHIYIYIYIYI